MIRPWTALRDGLQSSTPLSSFVGLLCFAWLLLYPASAVKADPLGMTVSQVDLNRGASVLEVAVRVDPKQLGEALTHYFGETVDLAKAQSLDPAAVEILDRRMARYLRDTFLLTASDGSPLSLRWVGWERESFRRIWMYAEIPLTTDGVGYRLDDVLVGLTVSQRMFFELKTRQANTVRVRDGDWQTAVTCTREQPDHTVRPGVAQPGAR